MLGQLLGFIAHLPYLPLLASLELFSHLALSTWLAYYVQVLHAAGLGLGALLCGVHMVVAPG